ncbi:MAG: hypothetical protein V4674_01455 [Patescibacteria group bacterium]
MGRKGKMADWQYDSLDRMKVSVPKGISDNDARDLRYGAARDDSKLRKELARKRSTDAVKRLVEAGLALGWSYKVLYKGEENPDERIVKWVDLEKWRILFCFKWSPSSRAEKHPERINLASLRPPTPEDLLFAGEFEEQKRQEELKLRRAEFTAYMVKKHCLTCGKAHSKDSYKGCAPGVWTKLYHCLTCLPYGGKYRWVKNFCLRCGAKEEPGYKEILCPTCTSEKAKVDAET